MKLFELFTQNQKFGPEEVLCDKNGDEYTVQRTDYQDSDGKNRISYEVRLQGKPSGTWTVAGVTMSWKNPRRAMSLGVNPKYQRLGIATALYSHIEKDLGIEMEPNWALTDDGEAFWNSRKRTPKEDKT